MHYYKKSDIIILVVKVMVGLYLHIPFCAKLCTYCDFPKRINQSVETMERYLNALEAEIKQFTPFDTLTFDTIYLGGGTPNSLNNRLLERLFQIVHLAKLHDEMEFTIECNVEFITESQVQLFSRYGVNRVSLGVQTFQPEMLLNIHRDHTKTQIVEAIRLLKQYGISNINLDMIFGLPGYCDDVLAKDLAEILTLDVPHISFYSLILEGKTVLSQELEHGIWQEQEDEERSNMFEIIIQSLKQAGYHHYEISNFSKLGYESKHNLKYWKREEYLGFGLGAASYYHHMLMENTRNLSEYLSGKYILNQTAITWNNQKEEFFWMGLRMMDGVNLLEYQSKFQSDAFYDFPIQVLINKQLLQCKNHQLSLTQLGLLYGNYVFSHFMEVEDENIHL